MISLSKKILYQRYGRMFLSSYRRWLSENTFKNTNSVVVSGPYKNLKISEISNWGKGDLIGKINGTYELSVAQKLFDLVHSRKITTFVDIGCADGFHATGIGSIDSIKDVICFDIDEISLGNCQYNAIANGIVNKFKFQNRKFTKTDLVSVPDNSLILIDIEGAEYELLDEDYLQLHKRKKITSVVELHSSKMNSPLIERVNAAGLQAELFSISKIEIDYKNDIKCLDENQFMLLLSQGRRDYQEWLEIKDMDPCI